MSGGSTTGDRRGFAGTRASFDLRRKALLGTTCAALALAIVPVKPLPAEDDPQFPVQQIGGTAASPNARDSDTARRSTTGAADHSFRQIARQMLTEAKNLAARGDLAGARRLATRANSFSIDWSDQADSPAAFLQELDAQERAGQPDDTGPSFWEHSRDPRSRSQRSGSIGLWTPQGEPAVKSADLNIPDDDSLHSADSFFPPEDGGVQTAPFIRTVPLGDRDTAEVAPSPLREHQLGSAELNVAPALLGLREHTVKSADSSVATRAADPNASLLTTAMVQLISTLAGFLFGLLVLILALPFVVRKYGSKLGPIFRVELVNTGPFAYAAGTQAPPWHEMAAGSGEEQEPSIRGVDFGDQAFPFKVVGGSYEEERKRKEEEERQREIQILKHIFEDNLELREQLNELRDEAA